MSKALDAIPWGEPPCCPDFFICCCHGNLSIECTRHHENPCTRSEGHSSVTREQWHDWAERWERELLDRHITAHQVLEAFGLPDWWNTRALNALI
ncbi:hypothetical protein QFZ75_007929 [Streptomyces sp. V3I8]|uniref:hypothetical protein n=1 Tax=Streptomyces sp. V3I8 TaxID=3042279 RepID=UPI002781093D|nr:hypothetical protein [Streptomyces sp. V3I8]MDQ1041427.1 hypothetical protein [Streptomyces sp. V3I8]